MSGVGHCQSPIRHVILPLDRSHPRRLRLGMRFGAGSAKPSAYDIDSQCALQICLKVDMRPILSGYCEFIVRLNGQKYRNVC